MCVDMPVTVCVAVCLHAMDLLLSGGAIICT